MTHAPKSSSGKSLGQRLPFWPLLILIPVIFGSASLRQSGIGRHQCRLAISIFPAHFQAGHNANTNNRMGGEFFNIVLSLSRGNGFPLIRSTVRLGRRPGSRVVSLLHG